MNFPSSPGQHISQKTRHSSEAEAILSKVLLKSSPQSALLQSQTGLCRICGIPRTTPQLYNHSTAEACHDVVCSQVYGPVKAPDEAGQSELNLRTHRSEPTPTGCPVTFPAQKHLHIYTHAHTQYKYFYLTK